MYPGTGEWKGSVSLTLEVCVVIQSKVCGVILLLFHVCLKSKVF